MSRTVTVVTPENVQVTYQVAGFASRFVATLVDLILQALMIFLVLWVISLFNSLDGGAGFGLGSIVTAVGLVVDFLILFAYPIFWEMRWGGRTPGKRLMGLRVIRDGGYPINLVSSATRNVLRFIDFGILPITPPLALCGLPGLITIFLSPTYKRIGDYAAGTLVIVEAGMTPFAGDRQPAPTRPTVAQFMPLVRNLDRLTPEEYRVVRRFTSRRERMDLPVQAALGERLARPLLQKLEIPVQIMYQLQFADLLEAIERRYSEERGIL
jgi:uncharacterized RDD family membrane protein YckC